MIIFEFDTNLKEINNMVKYRNIDDDIWYYLYLNIETLNLLLFNFGIFSTLKMPTKDAYCDNPYSGREINVKYCGADIKLYCGNNNNTFNLSDIEKN